jgi:hypothetical protein
VEQEEEEEEEKMGGAGGGGRCLLVALVRVVVETAAALARIARHNFDGFSAVTANDGQVACVKLHSACIPQHQLQHCPCSDTSFALCFARAGTYLGWHTCRAPWRRCTRPSSRGIRGRTWGGVERKGLFSCFWDGWER